MLYNFAAGPAALPKEVILKAQAECLNWRNTGMSVMELPHRGPLFLGLAEELRQKIRRVLSIPNNYTVLFLQNGGRGQFDALPLNFVAPNQSTNYIVSGYWSKLAAEVAASHSLVNRVFDCDPKTISALPEPSTWGIDPKAQYCFYVDNETINGVEFATPPALEGQLLVSDMSSNILSRPIEIDRFGLIFACAQKNLGISGLTLVIIREDLLAKSPSHIPATLSYKVHAEHDSMYYTPCNYAWYMADLILGWVEAGGGVTAMAALNQAKSQKLYAYLDQQDFYLPRVSAPYRSRMNVVFDLFDESKTDEFVLEAEQNGLMNLKNHRWSKGIRASLYNGIPLEAVQALVDFMEYYRLQQQKTTRKAGASS